MSASQGPTMPRRRLGAELRRFREAAGMTLEQAADALECSVSKMSRLETGKGLPKQRDVRDLTRLYGKEAEHALERLLKLAREGARAGWWQAYTPLLAAEPFVLDGADRYAALEHDASVINVFDMSAFHGLLQAPGYARAILEEMLPQPTENELATLIEFRMKRQRVLHRPDSPLRLNQIVDEGIVRRLMQIGGDVAREQFDYALDMLTKPTVVIQILPFSAGFVRALAGNFAVIEFDESVDQDVVFVETHAGASYLEGDFGVDTFKSVFDRARSQALGPVDSEKMLRDRRAALA
jgi:transcriptional regulator with XRE-family HTH domain